MILSTNFLNYSLIKYNNENIRIKENYNHENDKNKNEMNCAMFYAAVIFMIVEIILLYYAIIISLRISRNNTERIIFILLSITYTTPFVLFMILFNEDARKALA